MTQDAESHASEDTKRRQLAEAKNEADTLVYTVEKSLKDYGDKITEDEKQQINTALEKCKSLKDTSEDPEEIRQAMNRIYCRCGTYYRIRKAVERAAELATLSGAQEI